MTPTSLRTLLPALLLLAFPAAAQPSQEVTLAPARDNTLFDDAAGSLSNGAGAYLFTGRTVQANGYLRRALLFFDVAAALPAGARVESAALTLTVTKSISPSPQNVGLHRALAGWGEGTSNAVCNGGNEGCGAGAAAGDATWLHRRAPGERWTAPGGDFQPAASGTISVAAMSVGANTWPSSPALVADVQAWLDAPAGNFGWAVIGGETPATKALQLASRENPVASNRPALVVRYTVSTASEAASGPGALALTVGPNPLGARATVRYTLGAPGAVQLAVYDALGRRVATLADGPRAAGPHEAPFDARALAPGAYLVRLVTPTGTATVAAVRGR